MKKKVDELVGQEIEGWLLTDVLGNGADGIVYIGVKGEEVRAIKLFFPEVLQKNGVTAARERLDLQLSLIGEKRHPNLVEVFDGGEVPALDTIFLVMELVPGKSVDKILGKIPKSEVPVLAGQLASAARYLEEELGIVHRDIKPANIVISEDFKSLTLLDLGIIYQHTERPGQDRLSGNEFVATLRYSPPEFVWREEQDVIDEGWRAITLYQIGATLHDMIMGKLLFHGIDTPRAKLYDAVKYHTPEVMSDGIDDRIIQVVRGCLVKDWRQRLQLVSWDNFCINEHPVDSHYREKRIRLLQIRKDEMRREQEMKTAEVFAQTREQELWVLNSNLVSELRRYLMESMIFPRFSINEITVTAREYNTAISFEEDTNKSFPQGLAFSIALLIDESLIDATKLLFRAEMNGESIFSSTWFEMLSVESAFSKCEISFLDTIETLLDSEK